LRRVAVALAVILGALLVGHAADAEHEVYYRYTVLGYVKDARGRVIAKREVMIIRDKTGFSYLGETDARGLYVIVLRLGDESRGETLTARAGTATTRIDVRFEPANRTEERGTRLDLDGARFVERSAWFPSTLALYLGATTTR
jgi:hypothetical protein